MPPSIEKPSPPKAKLPAFVRLGAWLLLALVVAAAALYPKEIRPQPASLASWEETKASELPRNELPGEFTAPARLNLANLAWEDGLYVSRDGLTLYCTYFPGDLFAVLLSGVHPDKFYKFQRGPLIGQDFVNPLGQSSPWLHADIAMASRSDSAQPFSPWRLSAQKGKFYNHGGVQAVASPGDPAKYDLVVYTDDSKSHVTVMLLNGSDRNLAGTGEPLPANVDNPQYNEDNPHIERWDPADPKKLVLFFDSDNWPGRGGRDIWFATSNDGAKTWTDPHPANSLNTATDDQQPHLFYDQSRWWLYFSAINPADHKLAIFRAAQSKPGNWDSWTNKQLVVSAGTASAVGEPTLTSARELFFVVATHNAHGTRTDQFDCDPWSMKPARSKP
jgi:hypothetical protein